MTAPWNAPGFWRLFLGLWAGKTVAVVLLALAAESWGDTSRFGLTAVRWPQVGPPTMESRLGAWDAAHYLLLATGGYFDGLPSCAFHPLWPFVMRCLHAVGLPWLWGSVVAAQAFSSLACAMFHQLALRRVTPSIARWSLALLVVFPGSVFLHFPYSENLFLLELCLLMDALDRRRLGWAVLAAFLMPLTRPVGILCGLPLAWSLVAGTTASWDPQGAGSPAEVPSPSSVIGALSRPGPWVVLGALVMGWVSHLLLMWTWTGNAWASIDAQAHWGLHAPAHLVDPVRSVILWTRASAWHAMVGSFLDRLVFVPVLATAILLWRRATSDALWILSLGILTAMSGGFSSYVRFAAMAIPCFWWWARWLNEASNTPLRWPVLGAMAAIHAQLAWRFVNFTWAG